MSSHFAGYQKANHIVLDTPAAISAIIARLRDTHHAASLPLYEAALARQLSIVLIPPGGRVTGRLLDHTRPTTVMVISGDPPDGTQAPPPEAFAQARRLMEWSAFTMLHATGGQQFHYHALVEAAQMSRRALLIETCTAQEDAWVDVMQGEIGRRGALGRATACILLSARPRGGVHPALAKREVQ